MATYTPLHLTRRSPHSFDCNDVVQLVHWLEARAFFHRPLKHSLTEYARLERLGRIVIIYKSGAVSIQGVNPAPCMRLLEELVQPEQMIEQGVLL